jgi:tetratricopeptide (TPR) repeat protein
VLFGLALLGPLGEPLALAAQEHRHAPHEGERVGRVRFPVTCRPAARAAFQQAVAYLHSFWYEKAEAAFAEVVAADSTCAMAHWGVAMSLFHPLWTPPPPAEHARGLGAAERSVSLAPSPRERDYAEAVATYYRDHQRQSLKSRLEAYARAMASVHRRHPQDREATIFYGLALIAVGQANPTDTTFANQRRAHALLEPVFRAQPGHPGLAHYLIHATDYPVLARLGLYAARRYAEIAPDVPHAQHMPSHIFTRLGMWDEVIASNLRSAEAARQFELSQQLDALWDQRGHAYDYLVYGYLQQGRDADATRVIDAIAGVTRVFPPVSLVNDYALAAMPARYAVERDRWDEASRLSLRAAPAWPAAEAITRFARAIGGARRGDARLAAAEVDSLSALEERLTQLGGPQTEWAGQVRIQRLAVAAWLARVEGDTARALRLASEAAELDDRTAKHPVTPGAVLPARELEADLLLELGRPAQAMRAYQAALARAPNRARSVLGAARAAARTGDRSAARTYFSDYLSLMKKGDGARPELEEARRALASSS